MSSGLRMRSGFPRATANPSSRCAKVITTLGPPREARPLAGAGQLGAQLAALLAQPEQLLDAAPQHAGEPQRHQRGGLAPTRLEDAERLPADARAFGQLALREAAFLPGPPEPRLEP